MATSANLTVDTSTISSSRVHPYVWGNFLEDIRDHMDAMLAYPLQGMDFEQCSTAHPGVSEYWTPITNGKSTEYHLEPAAPMHSGHSQRIKLHAGDRGFAGISQKISVQENSSYLMTLYARASIEVESTIVDLVDVVTGNCIDTAEIKFTSHDWREYKAPFIVPAGVTLAEFRLRIFAGDWEDSPRKGNVWFDHVSILPTDHVVSVKRKVFEMTRDLNCGLLRFGGNHISSYHWRQMVGPIYHRPSMLNEVWGGWATKYFGTDEFLEFCRACEVEPLICVNFGSGTPEEAAAWVEYCNGTADTPMGALRVSHGFEESFNVRYWEVGNEVYGSWQIGHCDASSYARRYVDFAKAMKAADPSIVLLACGDTNSEWNRPVLDIAGSMMDMLTIHIYPGCARMGVKNSRDRVEVFERMRCFPEFTRHILNEANALVRSKADCKHVTLAITEYNTMYYPADRRADLPDEHTLQAAVANAANLNEFIRNSDTVTIATFSDLVNGWQGGCIRVGDLLAEQVHGKLGLKESQNIVYGTPTYEVLKLYANSGIDRTVASTIDCAGFELDSQLLWTDEKTGPILDVVAGLTEDQLKVIVFVVNRSMEEVSLHLSIEGRETQRALVSEITSRDLDSRNTVDQPSLIRCTSSETSIDQSSLRHTLQPHSVYAFMLS